MVTVFVVVLALVWFTRKVWLLLFAGLLVALVLTSLINFLKRLLHVGHKIGLVLALLILAGLATGIVFRKFPNPPKVPAQLAEPAASPNFLRPPLKQPVHFSSSCSRAFSPPLPRRSTEEWS